jgi:hypothetical protein
MEKNDMQDGPSQSDLRTGAAQHDADRAREATAEMRDQAREQAEHLRERWDQADDTMRAVAAGVTLAAAGMTLLAAFWLVRSRHRSRQPFPSPAVHRR